MWCNGWSIRRVKCVFHLVFLICFFWGFFAHHCRPSNCQCSSIRPLTQFPLPCLPHSMPKTICTVTLTAQFAYKDLFSPQKISPEFCSQLLLIVAGDSHMPEHQEHFKTPPSSADGRSPWLIYNTAHVTLWGECAHAAAGLACSGRRDRFEHTMLSAAFICIVLSASAGPLPVSRRRKDNNALSPLYF